MPVARAALARLSQPPLSALASAAAPVNALELAKSLRSATPEQVREALRDISEEQAEALLWDWRFWARADQLMPPGDWDTWLILSGRGWGKSRTGAETVRQWAWEHPGCRIAIVGATAADVRDTMLEGDSGLLNVCPPWFRPHYEPSKRRVTFPNGSLCTCFSAEEPGRLRGPQFHYAWADEVSSWFEPEGDAMADNAWKMLGFCMRLGKKPRTIVTTTPKPTETIIHLATKAEGVHITYGHTYDNLANLAPSYIRQMKGLYNGTRLGQQELAGKLLLDTPGALFSAAQLEQHAIARPPEFVKIVVAVDPASSSNENNDSTGISVQGLGYDEHVYVLKDATIKATPDGWAREVVKLYHTWGANYVVAETNVGGEMVEQTIRTIDDNVPVKQVRAMKGKSKRAEPVAAKIEQGKVHLVGDPFGEGWKLFMQQARRFTGINGKRDDRVDAFCWGVHELLFSEGFVGLV